MLRSLLGLASPAGPRARLSVLILHRVLAEPDPLFPGEIDAAGFDELCGWLRAWFNVLPLDEAAQRLQRASLPERALAISFDDGYADNHDVALPILLRHRLPATFFIATGFLDGGRMWNDTVIAALRGTRRETLDLRRLFGEGGAPLPLRTPAERRAAIEAVLERTKYLGPAQRDAAVARIADEAQAPLPDDLMLSSGQLLALHRAGMRVGAHTVTHPILARVPSDEARREITAGKQQLEELIGERVALFAYPNGKPQRDYAAEHAAMAREAGFDAALSTAWGAASAASDRFELPRFTPWDRTRTRFGLRMLRNLWAGG